MTLPLINEITTHFPGVSEIVLKNTLVVSEGLFTARTTNLNVVKDKIGHIVGNAPRTLPESNYKFLTRYFLTSNPEKDPDGLLDSEKELLIKGLLCLSFFILNSKGKPRYLTLDGTSWENGNKKIHLLTLCVVINGVSIPIWWQDLDKKGVSSQEERIEFMKKALTLYNLAGLILIADREYFGENWFSFLSSKAISFIIRLQKDAYRGVVDEGKNLPIRSQETQKHQKMSYSALQRQAYLPRYKNTGVGKFIQLQGYDYLFIMFRNPNEDNKDEPIMYFLTTLNKKVKAIKAYPIRWSIECCFKHLKSNGFNLEAMNLKKTLKIKLMMGILVFLYTLAIYQGLIVYQFFKKMKKSDYKQFVKNGNEFKTLATSVFRKGVSHMENKFNNLKDFIRWLSQLCKAKKQVDFINVQ